MLGDNMPENTPKVVDLPTRAFLYTLDQLELMLGFSPPGLRRHLWLDKVHTGPQDLDKMLARNIAPIDSKRAEWRVAERELVRWCKRRGFKMVTRNVMIN